MEATPGSLRRIAWSLDQAIRHADAATSIETPLLFGRREVADSIRSKPGDAADWADSAAHDLRSSGAALGDAADAAEQLSLVASSIRDARSVIKERSSAAFLDAIAGARQSQRVVSEISGARQELATTSAHEWLATTLAVDTPADAVKLAQTLDADGALSTLGDRARRLLQSASPDDPASVERVRYEVRLDDWATRAAAAPDSAAAEQLAAADPVEAAHRLARLPLETFGTHGDDAWRADLATRLADIDDAPTAAALRDMIALNRSSKAARSTQLDGVRASLASGESLEPTQLRAIAAAAALPDGVRPAELDGALDAVLEAVHTGRGDSLDEIRWLSERPSLLSGGPERTLSQIGSLTRTPNEQIDAGQLLRMQRLVDIASEIGLSPPRHGGAYAVSEIVAGGWLLAKKIRMLERSSTRYVAGTMSSSSRRMRRSREAR